MDLTTITTTLATNTTYHYYYYYIELMEKKIRTNRTVYPLRSSQSNSCPKSDEQASNFSLR